MLSCRVPFMLVAITFGMVAWAPPRTNAGIGSLPLGPVFPRFGSVYHEFIAVASELATGDINADGLIDVASASHSGVQFMINLGAVGFSDAQVLGVGYAPTCIVMHDFDGDGFDDVFVAREGKHGALCRGTNSGALLAPIPVGIGSGGVSLELLDVDADGMIDLCVTNAPGNTVSIVRNAGGGAFDAPVSVGVHSKPTHARAADLDGDGDEDLMVACSSFRKLQILNNAGDGTYFAASLVDTGNSSNVEIQFALGDIDGDALPDLVDYNASPAAVVVRRNAGNGVFVPINSIEVPRSVIGLCVGRTDSDADADLLVLISDGRLLVLDNPGDGMLVQREIVSTLSIPGAIDLIDFDATGGLDLIVHDSGGFAVLPNHDGGRYTPTSVVPVANRTTPMSVIDADGDAGVDLVLVNTITNRVEILRNVTLTGFESNQTISVGDTPRAVAVGDVSGDGHDDILLVTDYDKTFEVIHSDGAGGFVHAATHTIATSSSSRPISIALGDIDNDGDFDAIIGDGGRNTVYLYLNAGAGAFFGPGEFLIDDTQSAVDIGAVGLVDLNADGLLDVVAAVRIEPGARIIMNYGGLSFGPLIKRPLDHANPNAMSCADLDGDGDKELIISDELEPAAMIVWNDSDTMLSRRISLPVVNRCYGIAVGDVDGDRRPDIVVPCGSGNAVSVLRNPPSGPWLPQIPYLTGGGPASAVLADFNGDGALDICVGVSIVADRVLSILPNLGGRTPPPRCPADIDGSATIDAADFVILAASFGASVTPGDPGDLNNDGLVNAPDFTILAAAFGSTCP